MSIPILSTEPVIGRLLTPDNLPKRPTIDYEMGGIALQDPTQGLTVQQWRCWYDNKLQTVFVEATNTPATAIFVQERIVWLSFCFDQNMRWVAAYTLATGMSYLRWYNSQLGDYQTTALQADIVTPFLAMDDKRQLQNEVNDVLLTYIHKRNLYMRVQRERFGVEHLLHSQVPEDWVIRNFGMSSKLRMQWEIR